MGAKYSHIVGYGKDPQEAFGSFRDCFIYHFSGSTWKGSYYNEKYPGRLLSKDTHWLRIDGVHYPIMWIKDNNRWKCYISE